MLRCVAPNGREPWGRLRGSGAGVGGSSGAGSACWALSGSLAGRGMALSRYQDEYHASVRCAPGVAELLRWGAGVASDGVGACRAAAAGSLGPWFAAAAAPLRWR